MKRSKYCLTFLKMRCLKVLFLLIYFLFLVDKVSTYMLKLPQCNKYDGLFSVVFPHAKLIHGKVHTITQVTLLDCLQSCVYHPTCRSVNYKKDSSSLDCELRSYIIPSIPQWWKISKIGITMKLKTEIR